MRAKGRAQRREDDELDQTAGNPVDSKDGPNLPRPQAEASREVDRQPRVLGRVLHDGVVEEDGQDLVKGHGVHGQEAVRYEGDGRLGREDLPHARLPLGAGLLLVQLGGHERGGGLAVDEGGPAVRAAAGGAEGAGELAAEEEAPVVAVLFVLKGFLDVALA